MTTKKRLILLALPTLIAAIVLVVILNWHIPTRVRITLTTDRMRFKIGGADKATILDSVALKSVVIEKFESVKLKPENLELLRPGPGSSSRGATPSLLVAQAPVVLTPKNARSQSNLTLSTEAADPRAVLMIDAINAKPSAEVFIETSE